MIGQILTTLVFCLGAVMATHPSQCVDTRGAVIMAEQPVTGKPNAAATVAGTKGWNGEGGDNGEPNPPAPVYDNGEPNNPPEPVNDGNGEPNQGERLAQMAAALKKANHEAATSRKRLETLEKAEKERQEAEMSEMDKLKKQLADFQSEAQTLRIRDLQRQAAEKAGLPPVLATRLQGVTLEELEADAATLAETLPKPTKTPPNVAPTNPGGNATGKGETEAERRRRLLG